jgi:methyl-accepting chemotaxis protein
MTFLLTCIASLLAAASLILWLMLTRERGRLSRLRDALSREFEGMSEPLAKVAFGLLGQRMESRAKDGPLGEDLAKGLDSIRSNFNRITSEPLNRLFYIGTDAWLEGIACARCIGEELGGKGRIAIVVTTSLEAIKLAQRHRSFITALGKEYPGIRVEETFEAHVDQERTREYVRERSPSLDAIYITGNSVADGAARGIAEAGRSGKTFVLCHDLDAAIVEGLRGGFLSATIAGSTYAQSRDSIIGLFNHIVSAWRPIQPRVMVELKIVRREDLGRYWNDAAREPMRSASFCSTGIEPLAAAARETRILVFTEDWNDAFIQMKAGVAMAAEALAPLNGRVIEHTLNQVKRPPAEVAAEAEAAIAAQKAGGLDGIVSFVGIEEMAVVLNKAAASGIPIATFNAEPLGLRSMVQWLLHGSVQLSRFTDEYSSGHREIDQAMSDTLPAIESMVGRANEEARLARDGADSVAALSVLIDATSREEKGQAETVKTSAEIANRLSEMVAFLETRVGGLKEMGAQVKASSEKAESLKAYSDKIQSIIGMIDDIAERTNILAFNAAIEATHAGDKGRGFKVISGEIRQLADKSVSSTGDIAALIGEMRKAISEDIAANARSLALVNEQIAQIGDASSRLGEMSDSLLEMMRKSREAVERNTEAVEEMRLSAISMSKVVTENSRISAENSSAMESIGGTFAEVSSQFTEMSKQTAQLKEIVAVLEGTVAAFSA